MKMEELKVIYFFRIEKSFSPNLDSISSALSTTKNICIEGLGIKEIPRSGTPSDLVIYFGIDCKSIVSKVKEMIGTYLKK